MRILLVTPYFPPQNAVASLRTHAFAREWRRAGEDVTVLTTAKREDQSGLDLPVDGVDVVEIEFAVPRLLERMRTAHKAGSNGTSRSTVKNGASAGLISRLKQRTGVFSSVRMPDLTDYWVKPAIEWARTHGSPAWDVVVSSSGPYTSHLVARALKRLHLGTRWVADFRDLWTDNHAHCGLMPFVIRERQLERACLRDADVIVTATDGLAKKLQSKCGRDVEVVYNGFEFQAQGSLSEKRLLPHDGRVRMVYTGTLYSHGQDVTPLFCALARLRREQPNLVDRFAICAVGQGQSEWKHAAERFGMASMLDLRGMVSLTEALRMQRDADALLLLDWRHRDDGVLTAKVFEYLAASAPILVIGPHPDSEALRLVERTGRGRWAGGDEAAISKTLVEFLMNPKSFSLAPNHNAIAELGRERQSQRLLELMRRMTIASEGTERHAAKLG